MEGNVKKQVLRFLATSSFLLMLGAMSAHAANFSRLRVSVPFDFTVGTATLEAGDYVVSFMESNGLVLISDPDGRGRAFVVTHAVQPKLGEEVSPQLVFNRYGNQHFLAQVWGGGPDVGRQLNKTRPERLAAATLSTTHSATNRIEPELVIIAAL
jgi:hypothetical protein